MRITPEFVCIGCRTLGQQALRLYGQVLQTLYLKLEGDGIR
jgi:hypothetical protein